MKKFLLIFCVVIITLSLLSCGWRKPSLCSPDTAQILGRAYHLSLPTLEGPGLVSHVEQYREYFLENGAATKCAKALGTRLMQKGAGSYSQQDYDDTYGRILDMGGDMSQARGAASSIGSGSVATYAMGEELIWLAQVLPAAARGDWGPYNTTGTDIRIYLRLGLVMYGPLLQGDPVMARTFTEVTSQFGPLAEYQIITFALSEH